MTTLANGVRVITEVMPHVRQRVGGHLDRLRLPPGNAGAERHLALHRAHAVQGHHRRSAEDIARERGFIGGNLDAFTAKELVCFNTKVLDEHLSLAFDVLADLVLHPMFREEDIEKEKGVILEEIKMEAD